MRRTSTSQKLAALLSTRAAASETTSPSPKEVPSILNGTRRENASRELKLPASVDIAKIISEDSDADENEGDDEEMPEALPEVSQAMYMEMKTICIYIS